MSPAVWASVSCSSRWNSPRLHKGEAEREGRKRGRGGREGGEGRCALRIYNVQHTHTHAHACAHPHPHTHTRTCMRTPTHTQTQPRTHTYAHTHTHTHARTHARTHAHTHTLPGHLQLMIVIQGGGGESCVVPEAGGQQPLGQETALLLQDTEAGRREALLHVHISRDTQVARVIVGGS